MVLFYVLGVLYCLLGFSIVCEDYFVASLLVLGDKFKLSDDVNGAPECTLTAHACASLS